MNEFQSILLPVLGTLLTGILGYIAKTIHDLSTNLQELNIKIAVVVEQISTHEKRIAKLEE